MLAIPPVLAATAPEIENFRSLRRSIRVMLFPLCLPVASLSLGDFFKASLSLAQAGSSVRRAASSTAGLRRSAQSEVRWKRRHHCEPAHRFRERPYWLGSPPSRKRPRVRGRLPLNWWTTLWENEAGRWTINQRSPRAG